MSLEQEFKDSERQGFIKQIADKLFQGIQTANNRGEPRRWIWELVQNAKDVPNRHGPVKIRITLKEHELLFEHNGDPFTIKSLTGLLQQVSSKSFKATEDTTTGKFGTGFITTHMLSKIVEVSGIFEYTGGRKKFSLTLNREANTPEELIEKVQDLLIKKDHLADDKLYPPLANDYINQDFETSFSYKLSPGTLKYAKQGVEDLSRIGAFTLLFNKNIGSYSVIDTTNEKTVNINIIRKENWTVSNGISLICTQVFDVNGNVQDEHTIAYLKEGTITIAVPVKADKERGITEILPLLPYSPTLFKDLPLIGTEEWMFPAVCNCTAFEPTEPRDGLYLHQEEEQDSWQVKTNRNLLGQVVDLFSKFVGLLAGDVNQPINLFLLCRSGLPKREIQHDVIGFLKSIQAVYRSHIKLLNLVLTASGYKSMIECRFPLVSQISDNPQLAQAFYMLCKKPFGEYIPVEEHYLQWLPIISEEPQVWGETLPLSLNELLQYVHGKEKIAMLTFSDQQSVQEWLNSLYQFLINYGFSDSFRNFQLLPNQRGTFVFLKDAQIDKQNSIPEVIKDVGDVFQKKYRDTLLIPEIHCEIVTQELSIERISNEINTEIGKLMTKPDHITPSLLNAVAKICNIKTDSSSDEKRLDLIRHLSVVIPEWKEKPLHHPLMRGEYNFDPPTKAMTRYCLFKIASARNIKTLCETYSLVSFSNTIEWLQKLVVLLNDAIAEIRPLAMDYPIFPNQNEDLCLAKELSEDKDAIADFLKEIHAALLPKAMLKSKLLYDGFENRFIAKTYSFDEIAHDIDHQLLSRHDDTSLGQDLALKMIDWLGETKNNRHRNNFPFLERDKANIVLNSLPEKKEPIFKLLRLKPDFEKLTAIAQSQHLDLLSEIASSGVDVVQLNRLYILATQLGGVNQLESIAEQHLEEQADMRFRQELGGHVEQLFKEVFSDLGDAFQLRREGFEHGQDFALILPNNIIYRIEIKSYAMGKERVHMTMRQGETAALFPQNYGLCVMERPDTLSLATNDYFKQHARFIMDIGIRLQSKVKGAVEIINMIKSHDSEENAIDFDSTAYRFRIGKKIWESEAGISFEKFISEIKQLLPLPLVPNNT